MSRVLLLALLASCRAPERRAFEPPGVPASSSWQATHERVDPCPTCRAAEGSISLCPMCRGRGYAYMEKKP